MDRVDLFHSNITNKGGANDRSESQYKPRHASGGTSTAGAQPALAEEIGARAKGGYAESFFLEKVPRAEAKSTAERLAKAVIAARMIIFAYAGKFVDPTLGDKGFSGGVFEAQWRAALEPDMIDATPNQKRLYEKLIWAGRQVMENNQDRINTKGVGWKNFLPAKWEREMGQVFTAKTGIVIKQPGRAYRSPVNVPDDAERAALVHYVKAGLNENFTLLHQGDDEEHNTATALYEYLAELSAHTTGE